MTDEQFVAAVKVQTSDAAVNETLNVMKRPPGRKPRESDVRLSDWYQHMAEADQAMLARALKEAAELAIFEFFCVLDGVTAIENTVGKGELELYFVKETSRLRLNDPEREELHNIFNRLCSEGVSSAVGNPDLSSGDCGVADELKAKLKVGDELDIHHVSPKSAVKSIIEGYASKKAPAVVLRKSEHRRLDSRT